MSAAAATEAIERILAHEQDRQTRFLAALVRTPTDNPPGDCGAAAEAAARMLEELGFAVERHPVPAAAVDAAGMISVTNLVVRVPFGAGPTIALNAHGDVVPPGLGWTADPYGAEIRDATMYGRGVAVSKSDFATYAFAALALRASGAALGGSVELHFTFDEETGGELGPRWLLDEGISKPDYAISAGFSYSVITAHNGCLHLEVEIGGRSAHAAHPETGVDALQAATAVLSGLYAIGRSYRARRSRFEGIDSPTLTVGLIAGGINTNVVPDKVTFRLDRRMIPDEDPVEVEATLTQQIETLAAGAPGVRCAVRRILLAAPFVPIPGQERLVAAIARHATRIIGEPVTARAVPIYTDARWYSVAGIPTVLYGAGPRSLVEANGHRADERLRLDDLRKATRVVALALADLLPIA